MKLVRRSFAIPFLLAQAALVARAGDSAALLSGYGAVTAALVADDLAAAHAVVRARQQPGDFTVHGAMAEADWVPNSRTIANPYFGQAMPRGGIVTEASKG